MEKIILILEEQAKKLQVIERLLYSQKSIFTLADVSFYTGLSKSLLYKLTSKRKIPHYCPNGKQLFFKRDEIDQWLLQNRIKTVEEIGEQANNFLSNRKI